MILAQAIRYVNANSLDPQPPFTGGWDTAAATIQDAIDAASASDLILVTNGVYDTGGKAASIAWGNVGTNRVVIDRCMVRNNEAANIFSGTPALTNSLVVNNTGDVFSAGVTAVNSTIANNTGRALNTSGSITNTIVFFNNPDLRSGYSYNIQNSCIDTNGYNVGTITGTDNIHVNPRFVDAGAGNYELAKRSQCIDAGLDMDWMLDAVDLAGEKRIQGARVNIGAYESFYMPLGTCISIR